MRSLYKKLKSNTLIQKIFLVIFFLFALLTFIFDVFCPNDWVTKFLKDFVMPILSPFVFLIFGMINTENKQIEHKITKK